MEKLSLPLHIFEENILTPEKYHLQHIHKLNEYVTQSVRPQRGFCMELPLSVGFLRHKLGRGT